MVEPVSRPRQPFRGDHNPVSGVSPERPFSAFRRRFGAFSRAVHGQLPVHSVLSSMGGSAESAETVPKPPLRIAGRQFDEGRIKRQLQVPEERRNDRAGNRPETDR